MLKCLYVRVLMIWACCALITKGNFAEAFLLPDENLFSFSQPEWSVDMFQLIKDTVFFEIGSSTFCAPRDLNFSMSKTLETAHFSLWQLLLHRIGLFSVRLLSI